MPITLPCEICKKYFKVKPSRLKRNPKFCSMKCKGISRIGHKTPDHVKEKLRIASIKAGCMPPHFSGEKSSHWKGGLGTLSFKIRHSPKYADWRMKVWQRDRFVCVDCKEQPRKIHADHIHPFSLILKEENIKSLEDALKCEKLWDIKNGRTLCVPCHKKTESYCGNYYKFIKKYEQDLDRKNRK